MSTDLDPNDAMAIVQAAVWAGGLGRSPVEIVDDAENAADFFVRNEGEAAFLPLFGICVHMLKNNSRNWTASDAAHMADQMLQRLRMTSTLDKALGLTEKMKWS